MTMQRGGFYNSPAVKGAVSVFTKNGNGFFDFAFSKEDVKQEAAISYWLAKDKTPTIVYRGIINSHRKIKLAKRNNNGNEIAPPTFSEFKEEYFENAFAVEFRNQLAIFDFLNRVRKHPRLEMFIFLFYVEGLTRAGVKKEMNITDYDAQCFIEKTKRIALECF